MKQRKQIFCVLVLMVSFSSFADMAGSWIKINQALAMMDEVDEVSEKYQEYFGESDIQVDDYVVVPEPVEGIDGKYMLPFGSDGRRTEWADKALTAQAGAAAGEMASDKAAETLAAKIPFGGLLAGGFRSKGKELAAITAIGGWDFIKNSSTLSFNRLDDYSVYLQMTHGDDTGFEEALAAAMAIYPDLESKYERALSKAYKDANKAAKKDVR